MSARSAIASTFTSYPGFVTRVWRTYTMPRWGLTVDLRTVAKVDRDAWGFEPVLRPCLWPPGPGRHTSDGGLGRGHRPGRRRCRGRRRGGVGGIPGPRLACEQA